MRPMLVLMMVVCTTTVAATQDPRRDLARPHLRAGQDALRAEHWDQAEREFKSAIELDPQLDLAHYGLGQAYMGSRQYQDALAAFTACRDVYLKNEVDRLSNKVDAERRLDDRILMLRDYRRSLDTGRQRTQNTAATISRLDSEIAQLEALRHRTPSEAPEVAPYISTALGSAHFRLGAFADAEREWRSALAVDPGLGEVHNNLAVVCLMNDRVTEAAEHVKLAEKAGVRVNPQLKNEIEARQR